MKQISHQRTTDVSKRFCRLKNTAFLLTTLIATLFTSACKKEQPDPLKDASQELSNLKAEIQRDYETDGIVDSTVEDRAEEVEGLAKNMTHSSDEITRQAGLIMTEMAKQLRAPSLRLQNAINQLQGERFLNIELMMSQEHFDWNKEVCEEYLLSAEAMKKQRMQIGEIANTVLKASTFSKEEKDFISKSIIEAQRSSAGERLIDCHVALAKEYVGFVNFVRENRNSISLEDYTLAFSNPKAESTMQDIESRMTDAEGELHNALKQLVAEQNQMTQ